MCADYLDGIASNLTDDANCGKDLELQNSVVVQAYAGLKAYQPLYSATCLRDADTSAYCFANAVTNLSTPSNVYFYYLPLNMSLPSSTNPSCSACVQNTMGIYQAATADRDALIVQTYREAARQVNTICGPDFVNSTLPEASAATVLLQPGLPWLLLSLVALALSHLRL